ncbi:MAG: hypothetical protein PHC62_01085, partial [Candidatus Izemoplasmatales bacterium]|nr:hypothetical protein [Candidatus Izemoplasmatales bacterium]
MTKTKENKRNYKEEAMEGFKDLDRDDLDIDDLPNLNVFFIGLDMAKFKEKSLNPYSKEVSKDSIRFLVDTFYQIQEIRKAKENQLRSVVQGVDGDGFDASIFIMTSIRAMEADIKKIIEHYTDFIPVCKWLKSNIGVGPMIAAGLYARLDITKSKSAGSFLSYCGLNDNNTPWLGKKGAEKIVPEIMEMIANDHQLSIPKKDVDKLMKKFLAYEKKKNSDGIVDENTLLEYLEEHEHDYDDLIDRCYEEGYELSNDLATALFLKYDDNMITSNTIMKFAIDARVNRRPSSVHDQCIVQRSFKKKGKKKPYIVKDDMIKAMSKPPYNRELKVLCFKASDCIKKQSNCGSKYGKIYQDRKAYETRLNEAGAYKAQAEALLKSKNWSDDTVTKEALMQGKLSKGHIDQRAMRYTVKLLVAHLFEFWHLVEYGVAARTPYVLAAKMIHGENTEMHTDYIYPEVPYEKILKEFKLP